jgi:hypothetical protein
MGDVQGDVSVGFIEWKSDVILRKGVAALPIKTVIYIPTHLTNSIETNDFQLSFTIAVANDGKDEHIPLLCKSMYSTLRLTNTATIIYFLYAGITRNTLTQLQDSLSHEYIAMLLPDMDSYGSCYSSKRQDIEFTISVLVKCGSITCTCTSPTFRIFGDIKTKENFYVSKRMHNATYMYSTTLTLTLHSLRSLTYYPLAAHPLTALFLLDTLFNVPFFNNM